MGKKKRLIVFQKKVLRKAYRHETSNKRMEKIT
jgi:hypothetical protein